MIAVSAAFSTANAELVKKPIFAIEIDGAPYIFTSGPDETVNAVGLRAGGAYDHVYKPWLVAAQDLSTTINDLDGGADLGEFNFNVQDWQGLVTASFPGFVYEGKTCWLSVGFPGMAYTDYCLLFTGVVDHADTDNDNSEYQFVCSDNKQALTKVVFVTGDDGFPTSNDHLKTLNGHPLDLLVDVLNVEVGIPLAEIDTAKIYKYRDGIFSGVQFTFDIDSPPSAKEFIEGQLMKPLGGYIWTDNQGRVTVNFAYADDPAPVLAIDQTTIVGSPLTTQAELINVMNFRFDKDESKYMLEVVQQYAPSISKYGQYGQHVVESDGMRSGLQGSFLSSMTSRLLFLRYGLKGMKFDQSLIAFMNAVVLEPGDVVAISHPAVPDRATGLRGVVSKPFVTLDKTVSVSEGTVTLTLVDATYLGQFGFFKIAPNGTLDWTAAAPATKSAYMFMCDDTDHYSDASAANKLG